MSVHSPGILWVVVTWLIPPYCVPLHEFQIHIGDFTCPAPMSLCPLNSSPPTWHLHWGALGSRLTPQACPGLPLLGLNPPLPLLPSPRPCPCFHHSGGLQSGFLFQGCPPNSLHYLCASPLFQTSLPPRSPPLPLLPQGKESALPLFCTLSTQLLRICGRMCGWLCACVPVLASAL